MTERNEIMTVDEVFFYLMRKLNNVAITLPRKHCEEILYIISQMENLHYFPNDIRTKQDYNETA